MMAVLHNILSHTSVCSKTFYQVSFQLNTCNYHHYKNALAPFSKFLIPPYSVNTSTQCFQSILSYTFPRPTPKYTFFPLLPRFSQLSLLDKTSHLHRQPLPILKYSLFLTSTVHRIICILPMTNLVWYICISSAVHSINLSLPK